MSRIRVLSEQLANQIAAGEVIERPASVVKELLENSIDSGADRISVQIEGGGIRLIRVMDNGEGMDADDVLLCLERHATSKLRDEGGLAVITTLGFRGEALPSIASVSRLTILSRPPGKSTATRAEVRHGVLRGVHEDGSGKGTIMEVRGLFDNMPARRKFLKSQRTEVFHIEEVVRDQALAYPGAGFTLTVDGRLRFDWPPGQNTRERVRAVYGYSGDLLPVSGTDPASAMHVEGFLLAPEQCQPAQEKLRSLVNQRSVQDRTIRHAVSAGMQGFLMKGRQPAGVLWLTLPPDQVDINVHPAKREIRFRNAQAVHALISQAVIRSGEQRQKTIRDSIFQSPVVNPAAPSCQDTASQPAAESRPFRQETVFPAPEQIPSQVTPASERMRERPPAPCCAEPAPATQEWLKNQTGPWLEPSIMPAGQPKSEAPRSDGSCQEVPAAFAGLRVIGQLFSLYLLCERDDRLLLIDQHAAHERILYCQLCAAFLGQQMASQTLLFPLTVELPPRQAETIRQAEATLASLGFDLRHFGDESWVIHAVPALLSRLGPGDLLVETLEALSATPCEDASRLTPALDRLFASMACKAAVKGGHRLQAMEMLSLLQQMEASPVFSHCPHGRPVIRSFSREEIARWFKR